MASRGLGNVQGSDAADEVRCDEHGLAIHCLMAASQWASTVESPLWSSEPRTMYKTMLQSSRLCEGQRVRPW